MVGEVAVNPVICPVCGKQPNGKSLADQKYLHHLLALNAKVNWALCRRDKKLFEQGFIALVEAKQPTQPPGSLIPPGDAVRTGKIVHVRRELADKLFDQTIDPKISMVFCEPNVIEKIDDMIKQLAAKN